MKLKKVVALTTAALAICAFALVGCSQGASSSSASSSAASEATTDEIVLVNDGKLTIAASLDFPPFENLEGEEAVGFEVDLMKAIAEQIGLEAEYLPSTKFDTIVPMISAGGKADVGASGFTITEDRKKEIDFTDVIMDSNQGIVVMKDSGYTSVDQLAGKKIGAQSGTTGYDWAVENIEGADVIPFDEMTAVFAALQAGQIDAIASDLPVVQYYVANAYTDMDIIAEIPTGEQYAIVVSQDNPALTAAINEAIAELKDNGTYNELYQKWFGVSAE